MKKIIYAGDTLVTGDAIAAAVLRCGKALAEAGAAEMIDIPVIDADGRSHTATLLIGPSSQIVVAEVSIGFDELVDPAVVARLDSLTARRLPSAEAPEDPVPPSWADDL